MVFWKKQIHEGAILFVCVAMIGSVMVDLLQSEIKVNGRQIITMILTPLFLIGGLFLQFLFVVLKIITTDCLSVQELKANFKKLKEHREEQEKAKASRHSELKKTNPGLNQ